MEQHYGYKSIGLDLTFDVSTALFFATNRFVLLDGARNSGDYVPVKTGEHQGVLYCFVFEDPPLTASENMVRDIGIFEHCPPRRPVIQRCALPGFGPLNFNEAAIDIEAVFYLNKDFDSQNLMAKEDLFPIDVKTPFSTYCSG